MTARARAQRLGLGRIVDQLREPDLGERDLASEREHQSPERRARAPGCQEGAN